MHIKSLDLAICMHNLIYPRERWTSSVNETHILYLSITIVPARHTVSHISSEFLSAPANRALEAGLQLCQMVTDFQNSFTDRLNSKFLRKRQ